MTTHLGDALDDARIAAEYGVVSGRTLEQVPYDQTYAVEAWADVRFRGQSHELTVRVDRPSRAVIADAFQSAYRTLYGGLPTNREPEIVTLRVRRVGQTPAGIEERFGAGWTHHRVDGAEWVECLGGSGEPQQVCALSRAAAAAAGPVVGPALILDAEATTYLPSGWLANALPGGALRLARR